MDLSVITVTHNNRDHISQQMRSVAGGAAGLSIEHFIVDNASTDGTVDLIESSTLDVKLIKNSDNKGFGYANNQAAKLSAGDFLLFLNPDMKIEEGSLVKMVSWMKSKPDVGIASCKLINDRGEFNKDAMPRRFPRLLDQIAILLKLHHLFPSILSGYLYRNFNPDIEQEVDSVRGSFMLVRRSLYEKLGWAFDPRYFIWFEDVDICRECKKSGLKVVYTPVIFCLDFVGQSFKKMDSIWKQKNFTKSMMQYFKKWEPWYKWIVIAMIRPLAIAMVAIRRK